ncbi:MAG: translation initiation factor IF-2, partial [Actinobacteria bacterium]|nr:translation initiation factor IF-2 [Actinomycetota bacterium]
SEEAHEQIGLKTKVLEIEEESMKDAQESSAVLTRRPPVIAIMGHVDHGKTLLLDVIRQSNVVAREAGGITQHIGAYQVEKGDHKLTFLDTPGHEAFTALRSRGAQVTDVAVLVVAADDGVKPQTEEAIHHAKAADIPIIVAINKIDKPGANVENCKQQLTEFGLVAEDWGGDVVMVPVSAKQQEGIDQLLEMIVLVTDMLELKASETGPAKAVIIESRLSRQKGPIATVLVKTGTLKVGAFFVVGPFSGKIRALFNDQGQQVKEAGPGAPVELLGLSEVPRPGDILQVTKSESDSKALAKKAKEEASTVSDQQSMLSMEQFSAQVEEGELRQLNLIIKADMNGSLEAIQTSIEKMEMKDIPIKIIRAATGDVSINDILLAQASQALVVCFSVSVGTDAQQAAEKEGVDVKQYRIIYEILNDIEKVISGMYRPEYEEVETATLEVRELFKFSKVGKIAGCMVQEGKIHRTHSIRVMRNGQVIYEGKLSSLKRFKEDVKEVASGFECGVVLDEFQDIQPGDALVSFELKQK